MSPELLRNQPWGHPVDVWAMGVTLMMLWTGTKVLGSLDDHFIEGRAKTEFEPPERLGPCWEDHHHELQPFPEIQEIVRKSFLHQKVEPARLSGTSLNESFKKSSLYHQQ